MIERPAAQLPSSPPLAGKPLSATSQAAHRLRQRAMRHPGLWAGGCLTVLLVACALLSWFWTPHPPMDIDMTARLARPSTRHWLGTDALGRDVVSQLLAGARSPLLVGMGAVGLGLCIGTFMGLLAAQQRGWTESLILKLTDVAFAFPALLTAIMLAATWGPGALSATLAIGLFNIPTFARISRSSAPGRLCQS